MRLARTLAFLALAACGDGWVTLSGSNTHSKVLAALSEVRQPDPSGMFPEGIDYEDYDDRVRAAAFIILRGMTRAEALAALAEDGFSCSGNACTTRFIQRETWFAQSFGIRAPGPLRLFQLTYRVRVLGAEVGSLDDLSAATELKTQVWGGNG